MFGTPEEKRIMTKIAKNHKERGSIIPNEQFLRDRLVKKYYPNLKEEVELDEAMSKDMAKKILSMQKGQSFSKIGSGDMVPMVYLSNDERNELKKQFGRLSRDVPGPSKGISIPNLINLANTGKPSVIMILRVKVNILYSK